MPNTVSRDGVRRATGLRRVALGAALLVGACASEPAEPGSPLARPLSREVIYHLMIDRFANGDRTNDQGGMTGPRERHGFDPRHPAYYHGGDLAGLTERLDYIQGLGATTVLIGPITHGLPTARANGRIEGGYHGAWATHLDQVDPHFGTQEALRELVEAAHARGLRVVLDVVVNATADLNAYEECGAGPCPYRSEASYPYTTRGDALSDRINKGYDGPTDAASFAALREADWAYSPIVPENARSPGWLNNPVHYHNRGEAGGGGEAYEKGDVAGLDDLFTEHPVVAEGLAEVYGTWIRRTGADGIRIRQADRVSPVLWRSLLPSVRAASAGRNANALVWGIADRADRAAQGRLVATGLPAVQDRAVSEALAGLVAGEVTPQRFADLLAGDPLYPGGHQTTSQLPISVSGPEQGRLARRIREARPRAREDERLARMRLGHALLMTLRGVPVLYYGDEQGFGGTGDAARQDMLASQVPSYRDDDLLGTTATLGEENFDTGHPLYQEIGRLAALRRNQPVLQRGRQVTRLAEDREDGLFAFSRIGADGEEILTVVNLGGARREVFVPIEPGSRDWESLHGYCASTAAAAGSYPVSVPSLGFVVCRSGGER